jgi:hypothetical protein
MLFNLVIQDTTMMHLIYLYKDNPLQLIYVNSLDMQISHISTQSTHH